MTFFNQARFPSLAMVAVTAAALLVPTRAFADVCDDSCDSDRPPCSVEERCPDSGVACNADFEDEEYEQCVAKAKGEGLELRCSEQDEIYCDSGEEIFVEDEGCAMKSPKRPAGGIGLAAVTFAAAAATIAIRRRRARAGATRSG